MNNFMSALKTEADRALPNVSVTENGAIGYKTTGSALVDTNFLLSSMRNMTPDEIWSKFLPAYNENPVLAVIWMFFARDIREGCGERRTFRVIFERFCRENPEAAIKLIPLIPFYGRWDDVVEVVFGDVPCEVRDAAALLLLKQVRSDIHSYNMDEPVSLLGKWLPSLNTSSRESCRRAEFLRNAFAWTPKQYRKNLSALRRRIKVVEQKMSANQWSDIDYNGVPSRAAMNYREAFDRHDHDRYMSYLSDVSEGKATIHSGTLFPYDIVHQYFKDGWIYGVNNTLEEQWKALPNKVPENESTLVVVDGSGSMGSRIGNTGVTCHDVARSLGIYFAEKLSGIFYNSFITFSANPKFVHFADGLTLNAKLKIIEGYDECSNTDIEKTFDLILLTAVKNHMKQSEIPANILIVSDMEFDEATCNGWGWRATHVDKALFDRITERWEANGYKLPRLVFWNVCSRTETIPLAKNDFGVALVSGFSPNIADMVMSSKLDPYECLMDKLLSGRYKQVEAALRSE